MAAMVAATSFAANSQTPEFADKQLTLDDCLTIAFSNSPTIKVADLEVDRVD